MVPGGELQKSPKTFLVMLAEAKKMEIGIIGAGIIRLTSALVLAEAGHRVTILARELPGDSSKKWASPWAGAGILPHPDSKGHDLQTKTFVYFWALAHCDPTSGVQVVNVTEYYDDRSDDSTIWYKQVVPKYCCLLPNDLPAGAKFGFTYQSMTVNPAIFLPWIKSQLEERGVHFIQAELSSISKAHFILRTKIIINASRLGACNLASDQKAFPVRGQIMLIKSNSDKMVIFQGSHYTYQIPRMYSGGVIVGGVAQKGKLDHEVDPELRGDILRCINLITQGRYKNADLDKHVMQDLVGFRPSREGGYRLEQEGDVIHAYGFGSLGYTYCYGVALVVKELVGVAIGKEKTPRSML